jgi:hypothetical protein
MADSILLKFTSLRNTTPQNLDGNGTVAEVFVKTLLDSLTISEISQPDEEVRTI